MNNVHRHKLRRWLTSMVLVATFSCLCVVASWFIAAPQLFIERTTLDLHQIAIAVGQNLVTYPILFLPTASWHFFDIFNLRPTVPLVWKRLNSYTLFGTTLAACGASIVLISSRLFHTTCGQLNGKFGFYHCLEQPEPWLSLIFWLSWIGLLALAAGKLFSIFLSHISKSAE